MLLLQHTVPLSKKLVDFDTPLAGQANVTASMNISSAFVAETAKAKAKRTRARVSMSNKHLLAGKELFVDSTFAVRCIGLDGLLVEYLVNKTFPSSAPNAISSSTVCANILACLVAVSNHHHLEIEL